MRKKLPIVGGKQVKYIFFTVDNVILQKNLGMNWESKYRRSTLLIIIRSKFAYKSVCLSAKNILNR